MLTQYAMLTSWPLLDVLMEILILPILPAVKVWGLALQGIPPILIISLASCSEGVSRLLGLSFLFPIVHWLCNFYFIYLFFLILLRKRGNIGPKCRESPSLQEEGKLIRLGGVSCWTYPQFMTVGITPILYSTSSRGQLICVQHLVNLGRAKGLAHTAKINIWLKHIPQNLDLSCERFDNHPESMQLERFLLILF